MVALMGIFAPTLATLCYYVWFSGTTLGNSIYVANKSFLLIWPLAAVTWILGERLRDSRDDDRPAAGLVAGAAWGLLVVGLLVGLVQLTPLSAVFEENAAMIAEKIEAMGVAKNYLLFALGVSVVHSFLEELHWRWFVFGQLRLLLPLWAAHVFGAVGFSLYHFVILGALFSPAVTIAMGLGVIVTGIGWSVIYQCFGSMRGIWLSHFLVDLGVMWVGWEALQISGKL